VDSELARLLVAHLDRLVHDVKSPLSAVSGRLFLALRKASDPAVVKNLLLAELGMKNLLRRFYNLYDIAAIDAGRKHLAAEPLDLGASINEALSFWRRIASVNNLTISVPVLEGVAIKAHKAGFERIVDNLLSNVFAHAEQATMAGFMAESAGGTVRLTIRNDGVSATEGPVNAAEPTFAEGATMNGLGLVCVKRIMEHWGGAFEARVGAGGDTFIVVLTFLAG
jgi:signal transduction histidine kinase